MPAVWTAPRTWASAEVLTAVLFNQHLRDNLEWLKTPASASATLTSDISTSSTSFVDATGLSVTFTTRGGNVLALCALTVDAASAEVAGFRLDIDGSATAVLAQQATNNAAHENVVIAWLFTSVSAASHTIKLQYRSLAGALVRLQGSSIARGVLLCSEVGWS